MEISKIDDQTIGIVQPVLISEIKERINKRNQAIAEYQAGIDAHNESIDSLKSANDTDVALLSQAADLKVADAVSVVAQNQAEDVQP